MTLEFDKEYLRELYEDGKTSDKKYRFQPEIARAYVRCLIRLENIDKPEELYRIKSMNFEALRGDKEGLFSIRVNRQYRIEFKIREVIDNSQVVETEAYICNIVELSNHYN